MRFRTGAGLPALLLLLSFTLAGLVHVPAANATTPVLDDSVVTEPITDLYAMTDHYIGGIVSGPMFVWSPGNSSGAIWVYGYDHWGAPNTEVAFVPGVVDVCAIDAADYTYGGSQFIDGPTTGLVLLRNHTAPVSYAAVSVTSADYYTALLSGTGYLQTDGTSTFCAPTNQPPTADPGGPYLAAVGTTFTADGSASSDPDEDQLTYAWTFGASAGTGVEPSLTAPADPGIYPLDLAVDDGQGGTATASTSVVVYDPSAGFVTGGGWFDSPAGAYTDDPTLTGEASFGFVSKYLKGTTVPTGNTAFVFVAGDLDFHSTSYEWLVVTQGGGNAQFKGSGTINGTGDYRFMTWAGDGDPDTFRIRIWHEDADGVEYVVYDNGVEQPLGGGSVVIHIAKK